MPIATSPTASPRPATLVKMEDRKRPAVSAVDDLAPPSKRQAVNGGGKVKDDSGDLKEEAWIEVRVTRHPTIIASIFSLRSTLQSIGDQSRVGPVACILLWQACRRCYCTGCARLVSANTPTREHRSSSCYPSTPFTLFTTCSAGRCTPLYLFEALSLDISAPLPPSGSSTCWY